MRLLAIFSDLVIPVTILVIILFGYMKGVKVYDVFIEGAEDGIKTVFTILPTLIGLMAAVNVLRVSGVLELIVRLISPAADAIGFPAEIVPLCLMRLVSSSAATGLLTDIFSKYGPDSFSGRVASVMMSCTETVFYTMSLYFMHVKVKKTGYTLPTALLANAAGVAAAFFAVIAIFGR